MTEWVETADGKLVPPEWLTEGTEIDIWDLVCAGSSKRPHPATRVGHLADRRAGGRGFALQLFPPQVQQPGGDRLSRALDRELRNSTLDSAETHDLTVVVPCVRSDCQVRPQLSQERLARFIDWHNAAGAAGRRVIPVSSLG